MLAVQYWCDFWKYQQTLDGNYIERGQGVISRIWVDDCYYEDYDYTPPDINDNFVLLTFWLGFDAPGLEELS